MRSGFFSAQLYQVLLLFSAHSLVFLVDESEGGLIPVFCLRERIEEKEVKGEEKINLFYLCCAGIKNCCMVAWI